MYRLIVSMMVVCINISFICAQVNPVNRVRRAAVNSPVRAADKGNIDLTVNPKDTIPLGRHKYYHVEEAGNRRYLNTSLNGDTVKSQRASGTDWDEFAKAYQSLQQQFQLNPFENVGHHIDTSKDLVELKLLNPKYFPNTAKVCVRQLTFNILLLNQLLAKPITEKADVQILDAVMNNIDVLVNKYIATKGATMLVKKIVLPNVQIKIFEKTGAALTNAKCYFISYKTCRDIACRSCVPGLDPCDGNNINAITTRPDGTYDCANPVNIKIDFGHYHFFVISNNKIRHYEQLHIDENNLVPGNNSQININLQ